MTTLYYTGAVEDVTRVALGDNLGIRQQYA
jgi:hypothetical protein